MSRVTRAALAGLACSALVVLDAALFSRLLDPLPGLMPDLLPAFTGRPLGLSMAHVAACGLFALALRPLLPERYRTPALASGLLVFMATVFMPVLGMLGLLACIVPALHHRPLRARPSTWAQPHAPDLPLQPSAPHGADSLSRAYELAGPLQHAAHPKSRTAALIATLSLSDALAVPLLRLALKDPEDDVRLLAYALLNRKEKAVEARIRERQAQLATCAPAQAFLPHKALAHDHWVLAHLGESQKSTLLLLCARAHEHAQAALALCPQDADLQFLLGRILLIERQLDGASAAFDQALRCGMGARQAQPFLAEIAFLRRHHGQARHPAPARPDAGAPQQKPPATDRERYLHDAVQPQP